MYRQPPVQVLGDPQLSEAEPQGPGPQQHAQHPVRAAAGAQPGGGGVLGVRQQHAHGAVHGAGRAPLRLGPGKHRETESCHHRVTLGRKRLRRCA